MIFLVLFEMCGKKLYFKFVDWVGRLNVKIFNLFKFRVKYFFVFVEFFVVRSMRMFCEWFWLYCVLKLIGIEKRFENMMYSIVSIEIKNK